MIAADGDRLTTLDDAVILGIRAQGGELDAEPAWIEGFDLPLERERGLEDRDHHLCLGHALLEVTPGSDGPGPWVGLSAEVGRVPDGELGTALRARRRRDLALIEQARNATPLPAGGWRGFLPRPQTGCSATVAKLIDEHIISLGIDPRIPPIEITDTGFDQHVERKGSPRAAASEMEHALRYHIRKHLDEDPAHYEKLSARLKGILQGLEGRWDEMADALKDLIDEARQGRQEDEVTGLDPETQQPFFDLLKQEAVGDAVLADDDGKRLCALTAKLVDHIQQEIAIVGFWSRAQAQQGLRSWVFRTLDVTDLFAFDRLDPVANELMELTRANHFRLVR